MAFLDGNDDFKNQKLRFVKDELEEKVGELFKPTAAPAKFKAIKVKECLCIKSFKVNTNEKFFINFCQSDDIIAPKDLTEEELIDVLQSNEPSSYRVPMSISAPRIVKDKSGKPVDACDIAVHSNFAARCVKSTIYRSFIITLLCEAIHEKYNIQICPNKSIVLTNRKSIGALVAHQIRVDAADTPKDNTIATDKFPLKLEQETCSRKPLVEELDDAQIQQLRKNVERIEPEHKLFGKLQNDKIIEVQAEFYLPKCVSSRELQLAIGEDRILVEAKRWGYVFDKFIEQTLDQDKTIAIFDKTNRMLQVRIPLLGA